MSVTLITGGVRSGKSGYAESRIHAEGGGALYVATLTAGDTEMRERVRRHRESRPASWPTWETHTGLSQAAAAAPVDSYRSILLDCVSNLLTFTWFDHITDDEAFTESQVAAVEERCMAEIDAIVAFANTNGKNLYLVTNEVGWGVVPPTPLGRAYRDTLGRLNQHCARVADEVVLLLSGIPLVIK
ncbi:MAG: bifunctional adenosylcobinamide kinase/adenosylcobinamide-phosphate guanylyltransferase [Propionibacteriaceae bacterium]|nr:bifunctional adenosylcobinamide kinase/adenosylcobinamide-phosphate guanylyltransferase [Propionibacteriaceae bacterium]